MSATILSLVAEAINYDKVQEINTPRVVRNVSINMYHSVIILILIQAAYKLIKHSKTVEPIMKKFTYKQ